jgi:hypothetical protein
LKKVINLGTLQNKSSRMEPILHPTTPKSGLIQWDADTYRLSTKGA